MKNVIISGFSGIGKSAAAECYKDTVIDMESSNYSKIKSTRIFPLDTLSLEENPTFPVNYVNAIEKEYKEGENKIILISCHETVRELLRARSIPYIIVLPNVKDKNEYVIRWLARGSSSKFIQDMFTNWNEYHSSCEHDPSPKIYLERNEYLIGLLNRMYWEKWK